MSSQDHRRSTTADKTEANPQRKEILIRIGAHQTFSPELWKAALVEAVATCLLMFTLITSIIACLESPTVDPKHIALVVFVVFFFFFLVTIPLSGGHMNPMVSFIAALMGVTPLVRATIYILAQCLGSIVGFLLIKGVMNRAAVDKFLLGGCAIHADKHSYGLSPGTGLVIEFVSTFMILYIGVTPAFNQKRSKELGLKMVCVILAASIAMPVFVSVTVTGNGGYTGAGMNPARCLGPAVVEGGQLWEGHWVFWVGPFLACVVYYFVSLNMPKEALVWVEGENDLMSLIGGCVGKGENSSNV